MRSKLGMTDSFRLASFLQKHGSEGQFRNHDITSITKLASDALGMTLKENVVRRRLDGFEIEYKRRKKESISSRLERLEQEVTGIRKALAAKQDAPA